jgi:probable O-glycosylation ligase (exosortase A-associated)
MLHQALFLSVYLGLLPTVLCFPFVGVLLYHWLDYLPPDQVYALTLFPGYLALITGGLTFLGWLTVEKKTWPRPALIALIMAMLLAWMSVTSLYAWAPNAAAFKWDRTVKVVGFAILTAQMLSTRARMEAYVWAIVLSASYFAVPSAIKVIVSGGSGGIGTGEVVEGAYGSFFGDRVTLSVVLAMTLPFVLCLRQHATLLPSRWSPWIKPIMLGVAGSLLIALIGTFARTAVFAGGAALLMLGLRSRRKVLAISLTTAALIVLLLWVAPENWFERMNTIGDYQNDASAMARIAAWKWAWAFASNSPILGGGFGVFTLDAGSIPGRPGWEEAHNIFFEVMAEHGFVGLGLFCCLIAAIYRSCSVIQKRARANVDLLWASDLARATQISLAAFIAGGMFVSIATSPFLYILAALTLGISNLVTREARYIGSNRTATLGRSLTRAAGPGSTASARPHIEVSSR